MAVFLPLLFGCRFQNSAASPPPDVVVEAGVVEPSPETFALGAELTNTGAIPRESAGEMFTRGSEMYLSVNVSGARRAHEIAVIWIDAGGKVVRRQQRTVPPDAEYAPFSSGSTAAWPAGHGRAVVVIDGRRAAEKVFQIL